MKAGCLIGSAMHVSQVLSRWNGGRLDHCFWVNHSGGAPRFRGSDILERDTMPPPFESDENKARLSLRKHRVTSIEAVSVFEDHLARIFDDAAYSSEECRELIIGNSIAGGLLLVCFTEPLEDEVRIINARRVTKREKNDHEEYIADQI